MKNILVLLIAAGLFACSSSKITTSWRAKDEAAKPHKKIMVIALLKESDGELKELMEGHLVGDLTKNGCDAVSAFSEYGPKAFANMTEDSAIKKIRENGFDAVMTIVLLNKRQERQYIPRKVLYTPYYVYHNRFWDYYSTTYSRIETVGYYATTTEYFWESNFYDMASKKLLYSVQTESFQPSSVNALAHEFGKMIVDDMLKKGVLQQKNQ